MNSAKNRLFTGNNIPKKVSSALKGNKRHLHEFSASEIKKAFLPIDELIDPLEELVATGESVFEFIRYSDMDLKTKSAFYRLEKQFGFYRNLLGI